MKNFTIIALFLCFPAFSVMAENHEHAHADEAEAGHLFEMHGLEVLHPWVRATSADTADVFMEIFNEGDAPVDILGGESAVADRAELTGFSLKDGEMTAQPLPKVPVLPGKELKLMPDQIAIRLYGLKEDLHKGEHLDLHLMTSAGEIEIEATVEASDATHHSHVGHIHK